MSKWNRRAKTTKITRALVRKLEHLIHHPWRNLTLSPASLSIVSSIQGKCANLTSDLASHQGVPGRKLRFGRSQALMRCAVWGKRDKTAARPIHKPASSCSEMLPAPPGGTPVPYLILLRLVEISESRDRQAIKLQNGPLSSSPARRYSIGYPHHPLLSASLVGAYSIAGKAIVSGILDGWIGGRGGQGVCGEE